MKRQRWSGQRRCASSAARHRVIFCSRNRGKKRLRLTTTILKHALYYLVGLSGRYGDAGIPQILGRHRTTTEIGSETPYRDPNKRLPSSHLLTLAHTRSIAATTIQRRVDVVSVLLKQTIFDAFDVKVTSKPRCWQRCSEGITHTMPLRIAFRSPVIRCSSRIVTQVLPSTFFMVK